jgi:hypothetical protein
LAQQAGLLGCRYFIVNINVIKLFTADRSATSPENLIFFVAFETTKICKIQ